jgi:chromatin segregation and condensation protein Rec8/ScpA/Scc1 (kleisin family)
MSLPVGKTMLSSERPPLKCLSRLESFNLILVVVQELTISLQASKTEAGVALSSVQSRMREADDASQRARAQGLAEVNEKERELQQLRTQLAEALRATKMAGMYARNHTQAHEATSSDLATYLLPRRHAVFAAHPRARDASGSVSR